MDATFKTYQQLMPYRVGEILVVSSPYDAYIMEEDGGLLEHVFTSYSGIGLLNPPRFTVVGSAAKAIELLTQKIFDLVVTMPHNLGMSVSELGCEIKKLAPDLPVILLVQDSRSSLEYDDEQFQKNIDRVFIWSGNRNIMLAIVKWVEDQRNVAHDIAVAAVRVLIFIEDSPYYYSSILPLLYSAIVRQTQTILDESLNDEHRLMKLRARTKILMAKDYEEGMQLYERYRPYIIGILSDVRYPREGKVDPEAGFRFRENVLKDTEDIPVLLLSSEKTNQDKAESIGAAFLNKNSKSLHKKIKNFLVKHLGFGDFVFRREDGTEVARASNLASLEKNLAIVPAESLRYHSSWNHFSNWLMARSEVVLAEKFRKKHIQKLSTDEIRKYLISSIHELRLLKQRGVVAEYRAAEFETDTNFYKIGNGSLGGKARGLAFMSKYLQQNISYLNDLTKIEVKIPQSLVLTTSCFDDFLNENDLQDFYENDYKDADIVERFLTTHLPRKLGSDLKKYLEKINYPLAVRSSSLLEDSKFRPYAGLYCTYMLPNNHPDLDERYAQLSRAIKMVYASVFFEGPRAFSKTTLHRTEEEKMAILIQEVSGDRHGDVFYPALSGTAQSHNFYPVSYMESDEGIAHLALGLGKTIVEGEQALRFSPKYPQFLPQFSSVEATLKNAQKSFFALDMKHHEQTLEYGEDENLVKREIFEAIDEMPVKMLAGAYNRNDNVIRDSYSSAEPPVMNFSKILKYDLIQLPELLNKMLEIGKKGLGSDFEMEYSVNLSSGQKDKAEFMLLQVRPMTTSKDLLSVEISDEDIADAVCFSSSALGRGKYQNIADIVMVKPESFSSKTTIPLVQEISKLNAILEKEGRKYLLLGPGRWGSADHCLGVPVAWQDISGVSAIVEASIDNFSVDPSQGTHFFQNITSLGIAYFTIHSADDFVRWDWFKEQNIKTETDLLCHIRLEEPLSILISGKTNIGVIKS